MPTTLNKDDWDFSQIANDELIDAWNWESAREIELQEPGLFWNELPASFRRWFEKSGVWGLPFVRLNMDQKKFLFRHEKRESVQEIPGRDVESYTEMQELLQADVHCLLISREASKTAILREFDTWLSNRKTVIGETKVHPKRRGRPTDGHAWLCDLAIFRVAKAGYTRRKAAVLLDWIKKWRSTAFTESHFEDAQRNTKVRLKQKIARIENWRVLVRKRRQLGHLLTDAGFNPFVDSCHF